MTPDYLQIDLFRAWDLPVIICSSTALGTINHTLLTIEALQARGIRIHGLAFIGESNREVEETIVRTSTIPRLGRLPYLKYLSPATLSAAFAEAFDVTVFRAGSVP